MKQYFKTKPDVNGNIYTLEIFHHDKTYRIDYNNRYTYTGYITIGKRDRQEMIEQLKAYGYTRID